MASTGVASRKKTVKKPAAENARSGANSKSRQSHVVTQESKNTKSDKLATKEDKLAKSYN